MNGSLPDTSTLHALLIGIDCYLPNRLPDGSSYGNLGGCVRDIQHVETFLTSRYGVAPERIARLTATKGPGGKPTESPAQWPTYENMVAQFKALIQRAQPGDRVYIHYSGHGGRARTAYPDLKGQGGLDETLVPTDIGNSEARYLRDVELAYLLKAMVEKGLVLTVVLDSCHSGGATRGVGTAVRRSATPGDGPFLGYDDTARPTASDVASPEELAAAWRDATGGTRAAKPASGWLSEPKGYTLLAACRANEFAFEDAFDGRERNGALTYWLLDSLRAMPPGVSYRTLHNRILAKIRSWQEAQTPQLQGEGDRAVLGATSVQAVAAIPVLRVNQGAQLVDLNAGEAHGLRVGALLAVYPPNATNLNSPTDRLALLEVIKITSDADSQAKVATQYERGAVEQGCLAVPIGVADVKLQRSIGIAVNQPALRQAMETAIAALGAGFIRVAAAGEPVDFQVAVDAQGHYAVWDRSGVDIPNLRPPSNTGEPGAAERVAKRLVHLTKYRNVQALENADPSAAAMLRVELVGPVAEGSEGQAPVYKPGDKVTLKITNLLPPNPADINDPTRILNVTVLDLQSDWGITQIYPAGSGAGEMIQPGQTIPLEFETFLPDGYTESTDILKVFATQKTTNFRWLELPVLDQPPPPTSTTRSGLRNPLEQLVAALTDETAPSEEEFRTRALKLVAEPTRPRPWSAAQVELRVKK